jgi:hypothetical protein
MQLRGLSNPAAFCLVAIVLICAPTYQSSETNSGTIMLAYVSQNRVVIVTDSRMTDSGGDLLTDRACKLIQFGSGNIVFVAGRTHDIRNGIVALDSMQTAKDIFKAHPNSGVDELATRWGTEMQGQIENAISKYGQNVLSGLEDQRVMTAGFAGKDLSGRPVLRTVKIDYETTAQLGVKLSQKIETPPDGITIFFYGAALAQEFLDNKTERARLLNQSLETKLRREKIEDSDPYRLTAAVEAAIKWSDPEAAYGGPVDTAVLDAGKPIMWIQRKFECYGEDVSPSQ